jgi:hypothetical protein
VRGRADRGRRRVRAEAYPAALLAAVVAGRGCRADRAPRMDPTAEADEPGRASEVGGL